ncbi:hypothetical protein [Nocardia sp. NPDC050175]|uniref:hypothetical protein n=1 Tax=Nocardia sp. NPDC050175 TaxID=3364317 RepID=UPI003791E6FC
MDTKNLADLYSLPELDWASGQALTAEYRAPAAGPPPWHVYRITATTATALGTVEPGGATRWRF